MERFPRQSSSKSEESSTPLLGRRKRTWVKAESQREQLAAELLAQSGPEGSFLERWGAETASAQWAATVTVTYQDLTATTQAVPGSEAIATIGSLIVGFFKVCCCHGWLAHAGPCSAFCLLPFSRSPSSSPPSAMQGLIFSPKKQEIKLVDGVNGILKPGRMTLLLGPPSSGKSTFLKMLSGRLSPKYVKQSGTLKFNGRSTTEFNVSRTAAYAEQVRCAHWPAEEDG
jgi:ABC-type multidrug transport system fused ATPase/permease subunit